MKLLRFGSAGLEKLYNRNFGQKKRVVEKIRKILDEVRLRGDDALIRLTRKFDGVKLTVRQLKVSETEASGAYQDIKPEFAATLRVVIDNINKFYKKQLKKSWKKKDEDGVVLGERYIPIESVGVYVPSGTVPLVSSVYMTVLPAKIAGVKRIVLVTPPNKYGSVDPHILVVANLLKVDEIYKVGGAQAIGALAFGTKTIQKVDKIVGPGNEYVTEAKRQVFGYVDIDMLAGPSEVAIIANRFSNTSYVIADLKAQAEHAGGLAVLITNSKKLANVTKKELEKGFVVLVKNTDEAIEVVNRLGPEHLEIMVKNPNRLIKKIKNAGAIFVGSYSPVAVGDYVAGPSHVLPTGGTARFFSGLGVADFIKSVHLISYSKKALERMRGPLEQLTTIEGLMKHLESVKARFG